MLLSTFCTGCIGTDEQPAMSAAPHKARISFILIPPFGTLTIGGKTGLSKAVCPCKRPARLDLGLIDGFGEIAIPEVRIATRGAYLAPLEIGGRKRIALPQVSRRETDAEPLHALRRRTVRERFGDRIAARALL